MIIEVVEKAGINGIIAGIGTAGYFGTDAVVTGLFGGDMPLYALTGVVGAIGSLLSDGLHLVMKDTIPISKKANDQASVLTGIAVNGVLFGATLYLYQPQLLYFILHIQVKYLRLLKK